MHRFAFLVALCSCTVSGPSSLPYATGNGIQVDGGVLSVDLSEFQTTAQADSKYLSKTDQAADSAKLGNVPAASYVTQSAGDSRYLGISAQANDSAKLGGTAASSYVTQTAGDLRYLSIGAQAGDSAKLGGNAASTYQTTTQADSKYLAANATATDSSKLGGLGPSSYLSTATAGSTYETQAHASSTYLTQTSAASSYLAQTSPIISTATVNGAVKQISVNGLFCGMTAAVTGGTIGFPAGSPTIYGYPAAKALCEQVTSCGKPYAHMCTGEEMVRSAQIGLFLNLSGNSSPWFSSGRLALDNSSIVSDDCGGWQIGAVTSRTGNFWGMGPAGSPTGGGPYASPNTAGCDHQYPIACCQ